MNGRNMQVMNERTKRGDLVRNTETPLPGWPYRIIESMAPMAAEPRATTTTTTRTRPPERRDDDD
eukprot:3067773-Prorocentrum_lima.AAC.1